MQASKPHLLSTRAIDEDVAELANEILYYIRLCAVHEMHNLRGAIIFRTSSIDVCYLLPHFALWQALYPHLNPQEELFR